jgi:hypothetical protein
VLAAGLLAGAAVAAAAAVLLDDDPSARPVVAVPAPLAHTTVLGSDLTGAGSTRDCRGRDVTPGSAGCTIAQVRLPGATIVAPKDGVVRRWAVRSAFGELQLQVLRARNRGFFQVATSRDEFVGDAQVHAFPASISVDAGDVLGLKVVSGSGVGIRAETAGATTNRWLPRLGGVNQPPDRTPPGALAGELLLRVEYAPGEQAPTPRQVKGSAAAGLPAGTVVKSALRHVGGGPVAIRLVDLSGRAYALDLVRDGRRVARMEVPDFVPAVGDVDEFFVDGDGPGASHGLGIFLSYRRTDSDRLVSHAFYVLASGFGLVS